MLLEQRIDPIQPSLWLPDENFFIPKVSLSSTPELDPGDEIDI